MYRKVVCLILLGVVRHLGTYGPDTYIREEGRGVTISSTSSVSEKTVANRTRGNETKEWGIVYRRFYNILHKYLTQIMKTDRLGRFYFRGVSVPKNR